MRTRVWRAGRPVDIAATLGSLQHGSGDRSFQLEAGTAWWATSTPDGDGTLAVTASRDGVDAAAWGAGSEWLLDAVPTLVGAGDDTIDEFDPKHPQIADAWRRSPGWRVPRTRRPFDACVAAVIEQKVTGQEARSSWRTLVGRFGCAAPGPRSLVVPPTPAAWRAIADWEFRQAGVTPQRIRTLRVVTAAASAIERTAELSGGEADGVLRSLPGVGVWTSAEVRARAHGDADAISFGDFHIAKDICWWLTGTVGDDAQLADLVADYRGHRYRVQRLMELVGARRPRRAPRLTVPAHRRG